MKQAARSVIDYRVIGALAVGYIAIIVLHSWLLHTWLSTVFACVMLGVGYFGKKVGMLVFGVYIFLIGFIGFGDLMSTGTPLTRLHIILRVFLIVITVIFLIDLVYLYRKTKNKSGKKTPK